MLKIWLVLVVLAGSAALWFLGNSAKGIVEYLTLGSKAKAHIQSWDVEQVSASKCLISAAYIFEAKGGNYTGKTVFSEPVYLNYPSASSDIKNWHVQEWEAWYNSKDPARNSLQKNFPFKSSLQGIVALGVFLYFYFLRTFLKNLPA